MQTLGNRSNIGFGLELFKNVDIVDLYYQNHTNIQLDKQGKYSCYRCYRKQQVIRRP
jgi:hypothetical protein